MTAEEFKKLKPELSYLEGDDLLNAIEDYCIKQASGTYLIQSALPIWKTHTFRWLFYARPVKTQTKMIKVCSNCNENSGYYMLMPEFEGKKSVMLCTCKRPYVPKEVYNRRYPMFLLKKFISTILEWLHIVRYSIDGRYDMFGDESRFVQHWEVNMETCEERAILRKRKWYHYIIIPRKVKF